jgi:hypothetical protein
MQSASDSPSLGLDEGDGESFSGACELWLNARNALRVMRSMTDGKMGRFELKKEAGISSSSRSNPDHDLMAVMDELTHVVRSIEERSTLPFLFRSGAPVLCLTRAIRTIYKRPSRMPTISMIYFEEHLQER